MTPRFFRKYGGRVSELEAKYLLFLLFALGGLASWADSEAVLPAYIVGMVLAGTVGKDHVLIRRLRTLTFGLLTPFYFIRAGSFVSIPALVAAPFVCLKFKAKLNLLAIVRLPEPTTSLEMGAILDDAKEHYEKAFRELRDRTNPKGIDFVASVEVGHPAEHIVALAEREHVDLIVMGRRGRTQVGRFILGSTSERVLRYAHCAVTVVK